MARGKWCTRLLLVVLLSMTACVPTFCALDDFGCNSYSKMTGKDNAHCYQWIAVKNEDPDGCDKVQSETWAGSGQNPPQDKCHLMIAEETGDPTPCDNINGGMNSYSKDECYQNVGANGGDADDCEGLTGEAEVACRTGVARGQDSEGKPASCGTGYSWVPGGLGGGSCERDEGTEVSSEPEEKESEEEPEKVEEKPPMSPPKTADKDDDTSDDKETVSDDKETDTPETTKDDKSDDKESDKTPDEVVKETFEEADKNTPPTPQQEKNSHLSEIIKDMDQDARTEIIKKFTEEKKNRDEMTIEEQRELLEDIKDNYEFGVAMDEKADKLKADTVDKLTEKVDELVDEKIDEAKSGAWEWFKDKTYGWVKGRDPANKKYVEAAQLAESRYNKAVEKYNDALDSYGKGKDYFDRAKKAYDEMKQVMDNVRRLQDKVKSGRMTEGQANAIKGGVLLGKGLEYTTKYIPVFGETISEVTAGTFQATMKFAEKRAERTTRLQACLDDPDNCDPNGISPY